MLEKIQVNSRWRQQDSAHDNQSHDMGRPAPKRGREVIMAFFRLLVRHLVFGATAFFAGHGVLLGELHPFGVALVAAGFVVYKQYFLAILLGCAAGVGAVTSGWVQVLSVATLVLVGIGAQTLPPQHNYFRLLLGGVVFALVMLIGVAYATATGASTYYYMQVLFEAVFAALLAMAFYSALKGLRQLARGQQITTETVFYLVLLLVSVIAGASQLQWWGVNPGGVLANLVVLLAAYLGGAGPGAAAGAVLGILPSMIYLVTPATLGVLAFAGFVAGAVRFLNRLGVVVGFMLGHALLTVYLGIGQDITKVFTEAVAAALLFCLLPGSILTYWYKNASLVLPRAAADAGVDTADLSPQATDRYQVMEDIAAASLAVHNCPRDVEVKAEQQGSLVKLKQLQNMVCVDCALYRTCWERSQSLAPRYLQQLVEAAAAKGSAMAPDMGQLMWQRCVRRRELLLAVNLLQQLNRQQSYWAHQCEQNQSLVTEQLQGLHQVMQQAHKTMVFQRTRGQNKAAALRQTLKQAGFKVARLEVYPSGRHLEVQITMPHCDGAGLCRYDLAPVLANWAGFPLYLGVLNCTRWFQEHFCSLRYYPHLRFGVQLGLAWSMPQHHTATGDGCMVLPLCRGRIALLLSDGMGTGTGASAHSKTVLTLLPKLLNMGWEPFLAARMLNAILAHQWTDDSFATLDLCVLDLMAGELEIIKIGAAASFYLSQNQVQMFHAASLPAGVTGGGSVFKKGCSLTVGDKLVMATDGVTDVYHNLQTPQKPHWITTVLEEIIDLPPQEVADLILKLAQNGSPKAGGVDDMTVLVAQIVPPDPSSML